MSKEELIKENLFLKIELAKKEDQIAQLQRLIFGRKSERFIPTTPNTDQLNLFEEVPLPTLAASETEKEKITYERKKKQSDHKGRQLLSGCQHLPVEIEVINVNHTEEAVKIGENITELIAYKPGKL